MRTNLRLASWLLRSALTLIPHSDLWVIGFIELKRFARPRWWSKAPFLPIPGSDYWRFRMESIYGDAGAMPSGKDLIEFLRWCLEIR